MTGTSARLRLDRRARERVEAGLRRIRTDFAIPDGFPAPVDAEAGHAIDHAAAERADRRDVELRTLDPRGSRDLDQAFAIERRGRGFRVRYAIADVAAVVRPGGAVGAEAWTRGVTLYLPDARAPLHPPVLSEGTASLLPGQDTPALLWSLDIEADGSLCDVHVERALVRSRTQLSYADAQAQLDAGQADPQLRLLSVVGGLLAEREIARGGVSLDLADQEVESTDTGFRLRFERQTPIERHNARLSLLTGMAAADLMVAAGVGVLRTLPAAEPDRLAALRATATELGFPWPSGLDYAAWIRTIDPASARGTALLSQALRTLRGASYATFRTRPDPPPAHAALAAPYTHVTAPLRRLVDRYAGQIALDVTAQRPVAAWVTDVLDELPAAMNRAAQRAASVNRAVLDLVEAVVLSGHEGTVHPAVAVGTRNGDTVIHLVESAVVGALPGVVDGEVGTSVPVRLIATDPVAGTVTFARA